MCHRQLELMQNVQSHLVRLSELMQNIAEALESGGDNLAAELDKEVDREFGLKERAMGALQEHRREHGC
jgi:hypothetical protein